MSGLIATGEQYKDKALSGFIRESAEEQKIDEANADREAQKQTQTVGMISSAASIGIMLATMIK